MKNMRIVMTASRDSSRALRSVRRARQTRQSHRSYDGTPREDESRSGTQILATADSDLWRLMSLRNRASRWSLIELHFFFASDRIARQMITTPTIMAIDCITRYPA
jgi:hypothetical protein